MGGFVGFIAAAVIGAGSAAYSSRQAKKQASQSRAQAREQEAERREMERRQLTQKDEEIGSAERVRYGRGSEESSVGVDDLLIPRTTGTSLGVGGGTSKPKTGLGFRV